MGNNTSRATQWSEEPAKPSYKLCLHRQWVWPYKSCTRPQGYEGDHCEEKRAGTVMVSTWWRREPVWAAKLARMDARQRSCSNPLQIVTEKSPCDLTNLDGVTA